MDEHNKGNSIGSRCAHLVWWKPHASMSGGRVFEPQPCVDLRTAQGRPALAKKGVVLTACEHLDRAQVHAAHIFCLLTVCVYRLGIVARSRAVFPLFGTQQLCRICRSQKNIVLCQGCSRPLLFYDASVHQFLQKQMPECPLAAALQNLQKSEEYCSMPGLQQAPFFLCRLSPPVPFKSSASQSFLSTALHPPCTRG